MLPRHFCDLCRNIYKSTIINFSVLNSSTSQFLGQYNHFKSISLYRSLVPQKEISMRNHSEHSCGSIKKEKRKKLKEK